MWLSSFLAAQPDPELPLMFYTTHKSLDFMEKSSILRAGMRGWQSKYPERWSFDGDDTCALIFDNPFLADFKNTYNSLPVPVMKADMWRLAKIYLDGGWWVDADTIPLREVPDPPDRNLMHVTAENSFHMCNMMFYAPARSWILLLGLKMICERAKYRTSEEYHRNLGKHYIHFVTGPGLFTDMLADAARLKHPEVLLQNDKTKWESVAGVFTTHIPDHDSDDILRSLKKAHREIRHRKTKFLFNSVGHLYGGTLADGWLIEEQKKRKNYH